MERAARNQVFDPCSKLCNGLKKEVGVNQRSATAEFTVPFSDLDPMGVVWHGNYAKYFEYARTKLMQTFDFDHDVMLHSGYLWPVIQLSVKYIKPLRYQQQIRIMACLEEWENRLKINYLITDCSSQITLTKGYTIQVAVEQNTQKMCFASPDILLEKLGVKDSG
jgi:acyl-CoA thioester hydrolase